MSRTQASPKRKLLLIITATTAALTLLIAIFWPGIISYVFRPTESTITNDKDTTVTDTVETVASNISTPWAIAFLPNNGLLVTERSGQVRRIGENGDTYTISGVRETSEGGLLGIALHPDFQDNQYVYLYSTTDSTGTLTNRVERYRLTDRALQNRTEILANIPASSNHDGGVLAFGPDGKLYVTTGDAGNQDSAQDRQSLAGKILRINADGAIPNDNPFKNEVWSYGHRNPQGIAWDDKGRLWSTEHGPSGNATGRDELNLIEKGANYGWPLITGDQTRANMKTPIAQSGDNDTWAPGGLAFAKGSLYFAGLRGQALYQAKINDDTTVTLSKHFSETYGRLRAVAVRDDILYFSTSNKDGRGWPASSDDRILSLRLN